MSNKRRIIAKRKLTRTDPDGSEHKVVVRIERPRRSKGDGMGWTCRFRLDGLHDRKGRWVLLHGFDSLYAILACIHVMHVHLYGRRNQEVRVTWWGDADIGIPMTFGPKTGNPDTTPPPRKNGKQKRQKVAATDTRLTT